MKRIIYETAKLIIEHEFELAWLREKSSREILLEDQFYGDPQCGFIDKNSQWAIVAGHHLTVWTPDKIKTFDTTIINDIHTIRAKGPSFVEILTDPWGESPAIWELNIITLELIKIRDFDDYKNRPYVEQVEW